MFAKFLNMFTTAPTEQEKKNTRNRVIQIFAFPTVPEMETDFFNFTPFQKEIGIRNVQAGGRVKELNEYIDSGRITPDLVLNDKGTNLLMALCCQNTSLESEIYNKDAEIEALIRSLVGKGADINAVDNDGRNALVYLALGNLGHKEFIGLFLLQSGIDPTTAYKQIGKVPPIIPIVLWVLPLIFKKKTCRMMLLDISGLVMCFAVFHLSQTLIEHMKNMNVISN